MIDRDYMRAWQRYEETGVWPDAQYRPTEEDDPFDPESREIVAMVMEQDAYDNARKREREMRHQISALSAALEEQGIDASEVLYGGG
jgi:hypothetical protein